MQGKMHRIRSLTPLQAAGNALAMHVHGAYLDSTLSKTVSLATMWWA